MPPIIGITLDYEAKGSFSNYPYAALRTHYFDAITRAGGTPIALPYTTNPEAHAALIDGLIIPGGEFALPEDWYQDKKAPMPYQPSPRLDYDIKLLELILKQQKPFLGICAGMQILAGMHGGKMTNHIHSTYPDAANHWDHKPCTEHSHAITIKDNSLLAQITGTTTCNVNSHHQEAITHAASPLKVSAYAKDGVIEAIELEDYPFALGVQWHPEYAAEGDVSFAIMKAFVGAGS